MCASQQAKPQKYEYLLSIPPTKCEGYCLLLILTVSLKCKWPMASSRNIFQCPGLSDHLFRVSLN